MSLRRTRGRTPSRCQPAVGTKARATGYLRRTAVAALVAISLIACGPSGRRVGAVCRDGWLSTATGSGACSHHGGVDHWRYATP